jgi:hypothetical protein
VRQLSIADITFSWSRLTCPFLLGVMRDPNVSAELRIKVAQAAAPYIHAKPGTVRPGELAPTAKLIDGAFDFPVDPHGPSERLRKKGGPPSRAAKRLQSVRPAGVRGASVRQAKKSVECLIRSPRRR